MSELQGSGVFCAFILVLKVVIVDLCSVVGPVKKVAVLLLAYAKICSDMVVYFERSFHICYLPHRIQ